MRRPRWLATSCSILLAFAAAVPALAQQAPAVTPSSAPGGGAWLPGPAASGDSNTLAGVIDAPLAGASYTPGTLLLGGWFVDLTAQGWNGADDVEIFDGPIEGGGRPLGHAQFGQYRPDVAAALNNAYWAQSGWSASIATTSLALGQTGLFVYVHTPGRGWWMRQVSITLHPPTPAPTPTMPPSRRGQPTPTLPPTVTPTPTGARLSVFGNDLSYPQCPTGAEPPAPAFAIVGVTGGRPFTPNGCLARQFAWALSSTSPSQPRVGLYMNTANPGPTASTNWPPPGTSAPRTCDGTWSADCAYDYGWLAAHDAYARGVGVVGGPAAMQYSWWLDVESANSWSEDMATNAASVQGAIEYLRSVGVASIGIYSTSTDWEALIGPPSVGAGPFGALLNWRPGPAGPQDAPAWCDRTVTGGRVKFVQFPNNGFDTNLACF